MVGGVLVAVGVAAIVSVELAVFVGATPTVAVAVGVAVSIAVVAVADGVGTFETVAVGGLIVAVAVNDGVALGGPSVAVGVSVNDGVAVSAETSVKVPVGVFVPTGVTVTASEVSVTVGITVSVAVGGGVVKILASAERSALLVRPSPLTSVNTQALPPKIAATSASRSRASTALSQFASPVSVAAFAAQLAGVTRSAASTPTHRGHRRDPVLVNLITDSSGLLCGSRRAVTEVVRYAP